MKELFTLERTMLVLLFGVLLSHLGTYLVIPILPIMLKTRAALSVTQIGTVLAANSISFQFGSLLGGFLADRIGRRSIIGLGAFIGAAGLLGFGFFSSYALLLLTAVITGTGNGLNAPSTKAAIASSASQENRTTAFSLRGIAANIGVAAGGLIIFFLLTGSSRIIFWIAAMIYVILAAIAWTLLPKGCGDEPCEGVSIGAYRQTFRNKPFLVFSIISILIWALYAQFTLALPLRAAVILPNPKNVALIWTINSVIVVFSQTFITRRFIERIHPFTALAAGMLFVGFGVGSLYFSSTFVHLITSSIVFLIGQMLLLPTIDSTISQLATAQLIGLFFGLSNVVFGLGEAVGNVMGGRLLDTGITTSSLPWITYAATGIALFFVLLILKRWKPIQKALERAAVQKDAPQHAPKVPIAATENRTHPLNRWEQEVWFRKNKLT